MADMGNLQLILRNRIENQIAQTRGDDHPRAGVVCRSPRHRVIADLSGALDETRNETRRDRWIVLVI
jgi:hypothetical protein